VDTLLSDYWTSILDLAPRFALALLVLGVSYLLGRNLARLVPVLLRHSSLRQLHVAFFRVLATSLVVLMGAIIALDILGLQRVAVSLLAGGGVTAIVLGFAFREIGENFLAGQFLAFSRPFNMGDVIRSDDIEGEVRDVELRYAHIRTDDGRDIYIPSSQLFNRPVTNFTKDGLRRLSFDVGNDYADDAAASCELLASTIHCTEGALESPAPGALSSLWLQSS
jgi:small-conductance mechanosensitive channel